MLGVDKILNPEGGGAHKVAQVPPVPFALRWLNYLVIVPLVALATIFFGTLSLVAGLWDKSGQQQHWIARQWARVLLMSAFTKVGLVGRERLKEVGAAVYACNHLSYYDTPALFAKLPFQFRIIAKAPLFKIPFIGWYLTRSGQVSIDQSSARAGIASLMRGVKTIEHGLPLVVFPEGGRAADGQLQAMMAGAAFIAIKAQVPLVPLTLVGTYELLPIHVYALRPRPVKLIVGEPISTAGMTTKDAEALTERMKQVIHATYVAEHRD
ncbi:1-acyl-sn-glycerol-3-phosphate acyltransferase [Granulicella sp. 5B5]|uniref:lysophospholipid acyltransferase family protein n=1 Tax=Granulicella sp. 5B5 TaxID=1617967 RepID=UPI0015F5459B|nr:lysophospholipid acyltransferase family protein [Granulicella sp. 5B5]QMV18784.1 1-acyl-sn-glycerol-3-phosphate acyltransferase [Granulicella sp. 5B5]